MKHILLIHSVRISLEDDDTTRTVLLNGTSRFAIELIDTEYHSDEVEGVGECMRHCKIQRNTHYTCASHQNEYIFYVVKVIIKSSITCEMSMYQSFISWLSHLPIHTFPKTEIQIAVCP